MRFSIIILLILAFMINPAFAAELPSKTLSGHADRVFAISFSPGGRTIATASADNTIRIWDVESGEVLKILEGHEGDVTAVVFSNRLWASTGSPLPPPPPLVGGIVASASTDETIKLWNTETSEEIRRFLGHSGEVRDIDFSPDSKLLVSGGSDRLLKIWEVETGRELATLEGHEDTVLSVAFSPNGKYIASGSMDNTIRLWDAETWEELKVYRGHEHYVWSVDFSPDGKLLASGSWDGTVRLWPLPGGDFSISEDSGRPLAKLEAFVFSVAFSPDSKLIAAGLGQLLESDSANTVRIWDVETGSPVSKMGIKSKFDVAFSPDRTKFAACGVSDANVIIWQSMPDPPHPLFPENSALIEDKTVELEWQKIIGALYYEVEIALDSNFSEIIPPAKVVNETKFSYEPLMEAEYWWRVRTRGFGRFGDWSKPSMFLTSTVLLEQCVLKVEPSSQGVNKGDVFELVVAIENVKELAGFQFELTFNPKILQVLSVESVGEIFANGSMQPDIDNSSGVIRNIVAAKQGKGSFDGDGILLRSSFKALESGASEIKVDEMTLVDPNGKTIEICRIINANVIVEEPLHPWDVNGDGIVNVLDLVFVGQHLGEEITEPMKRNPDVNRDDIVDIDDITLIGQHFGEEYEVPQASPTIGFPDYQEITRVLLDVHKLIRDQKSPEFAELNRLLEELIQSTKIRIISKSEVSAFTFQLGQNYPNPFNPETWIPFQLADAAPVVITIFDIAGKPVRTINLGYKPPGLYAGKAKAVYWDGKNNLGGNVASGLYFYSIQAGDFTAVKKMLVAR